MFTQKDVPLTDVSGIIFMVSDLERHFPITEHCRDIPAGYKRILSAPHWPGITIHIVPPDDGGPDMVAVVNGDTEV